MATVVELIGPTASGKTTFARALAQGLRDRGVAVRTADAVALGPLDRALPPWGARRAVAVQIATLPWLVLHVARRPAVASYLARICFRHGERPSFRLNALRNAARRFAVHAAVRRNGRPGEVILVDEGLAHFVDMLAESVRPPSPATVEEYARRIPAPDLAVRVRAPVHARIERVVRQGHRRLRSRDPRAVEVYVRNGEAASDLFLAALSRAGRAVTVDAGTSPEELIAAVARACDAIQALATETEGGRDAHARP